MSGSLQGRGVTRSAKTALSYFSAATAIGPWAGWVRRGLDQYLRGHYDRSLGAYLHAAELGTLPTSNFCRGCSVVTVQSWLRYSICGCLHSYTLELCVS